MAKTGVILREGRKGFGTDDDSHGDKLSSDQISVKSDNYRGIRRIGDIHVAAKKHKTPSADKPQPTNPQITLMTQI